MEATDPNFVIAQEIIKVLAKNKCTVAQASEILSYCNRTIAATATVQETKIDFYQH